MSAVPLLLFLLVLGSSLSSGTTDVQVDLTGGGSVFAHYWKRCVGSGHMLLGTRADWRSHMQKARNELGFTRVRGHGILDDDMSVIIDGKYNFYNVDQVYDFLLSIGVRPVVELSFMPRALAQCSPAQCHYAFDNPPGSYKGLVMPPKDFNDWYLLVRALAEHLVERYGLGEVSQWDFEVWNEMWGMDYPTNYMALYNASVAAIKGVDPSLRIGGPATMQVQNVGDFIQRARTAGLPVDFVSTHYYPSDPGCTDGPGHSDPDCFANTVLGAQKIAAGAGLPFYLTEYNDGLDGGDHRDTAYAAGFVLHNIPLLRPLDIFSWWTFSDVFEEGGMVGVPFSNAYGLQNIYGVPKPVWRAFERLAGAGDVLIVGNSSSSSSITAFATLLSSSPQEVLHGAQIFLTNFRRHDMPPQPDTAVLHLMHGSWPAPATAMLALIDSTHANPRALWESWGQPLYPTAEQLAQLQAASQLVEVSVPLTPSGPGVVSVSIPLEPYACAFLRF